MRQHNTIYKFPKNISFSSIGQDKSYDALLTDQAKLKC